jgi:predicted branched-subunit amino acid permease
MHLPKRDIIATCLVAAAGLLYLLWAIGSALPGMSGTRATGVAVLALGFAASASAVVPTFSQLLRGDKTYLVITSLIGLAATAAGVQMLITASGAGLTVVMAAMAVLWLIATIHHSLLARTGLPPQQANAQQAAGHRPRLAGAR